MRKITVLSLALFAAAGIEANPLREAYYGDLHLHTTNSFDAYIFTQVDPEGAYRFARGETITVMGEEVRRSSPPLDFLAVTDHSEWMGVLHAVADPDSVRSRTSGWPMKPTPAPGVDTESVVRSVWQRAIEVANRYNQPGKLTTFIGYEWSATPGGYHLHRNVIFRDDKAPLPFTAIDSSRPEDLWAFLENIRKQGYEALAIPHNPNFSNGLAFDWLDSDGKAIDPSYAEQRAANEPLVEISQHKGVSETHPSLAPNDELASFELIDRFGETRYRPAGGYVRDALGRGMKIAQSAGGVNPFKYGFAGGSDFHNGLSDTAENAYSGFGGAFASESTRPAFLQTSSGSLTGVWAEANTREAIYAALRRKESFATSGTRLKFRSFGGWAFDEKLFERRDWVKAAYAQGVPMGSDLPPRPAGRRAPQFAVWAAKDPNGANLERLQIVKVSLEAGRQVEKIYDVARANSVKPIGATQLSALWRDPQFDPTVPAAYYLRVLEIPTPRWSTLVAARLGQPPPQGFPATLQERGWASPVWYEPRVDKKIRQ